MEKERPIAELPDTINAALEERPADADQHSTQPPDYLATLVKGAKRTGTPIIATIGS